ncbi:MAG: hypothetical protein AB1798_19720 [Spirochaetota bacterium]
MRKFSILLLFAITVPGLVLSGQSSVNSKADFSQAKISIAGPNRIYIRSIYLEDRISSVLLEKTDKEGNIWKAIEVYPDDNTYFPENLNLDYVQITPFDSDKVEISGIIIEGDAYSGSFQFENVDSLTAIEPFHPAPVPDSFEEKIAGLKGTLLTVEKKQYENQIQSLQEETFKYSKQIQSLETQNQQYSMQVNTLQDQNRQYEKTLTNLTRQNRENETAITSLNQQTQQLENKVTSLTRQAKEYESTVSSLKDKNIGLEQKLKSLPAPPLTPGSNLFSKILLNSFEGAAAQIGTWAVKDGETRQLDSKQFFAKLILPITQIAKPTLFGFKARTTGQGWVGFGLHIFAERKDKKKGYGFGNSLLIWLTRDSKFYGTEDTHVQLYRSDSSISMGQVLDAIVKDPISDYLNLDILYDPPAEYISIYVNGIEKLKYKTWFDLDSGAEIALRTLGPGAAFKELMVKTLEK